MATQFEEGDLNAPTDLDESAIAHLAGEDEASGEDTENFSKNVQKRISKEVKKRKVLANERDAFKAEAERSNRELAEFKLQRAEERKAAIEQESSDLKARAQTALEEGESENYMKLNDTMLDRKVELARINASIEEAPQAQAPAPGPSPAAQSWLDDNAGWLNEDPRKAARAEAIERDLKSKGFSVTDPETYEELDRQLNGEPAAPEYDEDDRRAPRDVTPVNLPGSHVSSVPEGGSRRLSREDLVTMTRYGLDPKNPDHRAEWLSSKPGA